MKRKTKQSKPSYIESFWIFEDFASVEEKQRTFAKLVTEAGTKLLVWTKDENVSAAKN